MNAERSRSPSSRHRLHRRGFGLIEMTVAIMLLAVGMVVTVQVVGWVATERRAVERRERAALEASNLMERAAARPWDALTAEGLAPVGLADAARRALPGSAVSWAVAELDAPPRSKRVTLEVRWRDRAGRSEAPVRLVAWVHRGEDAR